MTSARRQRPEAAIQRAVFDHLRVRGAPGVFAWHPFSGGYRRLIEAKIYKGIGARAGLPDLMVLRDGKLFCLELKTETGRVSDKQLETLAALREAGAFTCVAEGLNRALACLEAWGCLLGRSQ